MGFPGGSDHKKSACNAGNLGLIPGLERSPGEVKWLPIPVFLPGEFRGQGSLAGCSPWGGKELETTEPHTHVVYCLLIVASVSFSITKLRFLHVFFIT